MRLSIAIGFFFLAATFPFLSALSALYRLFSSTDYSSAIPRDYVATHIGYTNLFATSITWAALAWFGIRNKQKWAWNLLLFHVLFVGLNDTFAIGWLFLQGKYLFPLPLIPTLLGLFALALSYKEMQGSLSEN